MPRRLPLLIFAAVFSLSPALQAQEAPRYAGPIEGRVPAAQRLDGHAGGRAGPADRPAAEHPPPGRRPARPGRHQRVQRPRAVAGRPREQDGRRSPGGPAELVRAGGLDPTSTGSGGRGAAANVVHRFRLDGRQADARQGEDPKGDGNGGSSRARSHFRSGLALDAPRKVLYSLDIDHGTISGPRPRGPSEEIRSAPAGTRPYDVALARNGTQLYVSDWAGRAVLVVDPADLRTVARIAVGEHPNQIAVHPKDDRLFVACASSNCVSVIDTRRGIVTETIHTALFPQAPEGSTPDALAVAPDGKTLYVANADNNCVAVIDIAAPGRSQVKGFIPTGWYPTAVAVTPDGKHLLVGVGKGNQTKANPIDVDAAKHKTESRPGRQAAGPAVPLHRHDALGRPVDRAGPRREDSWPPTPRRSTATAPTPTSC